MDTSVFVPIAVEEIREGTIRTEVVEDRTALLADIRAIADQQAQDDRREELLGKTTVVDREPDTSQATAGEPAAIVVMSNADDEVVSTSGLDDRFVPQVFLDGNGDELAEQDAGKDVIIDLDRRVEASAPSDTVELGQEDVTEDVVDEFGVTNSVVTQQVNMHQLGDVIYLEGVRSNHTRLISTLVEFKVGHGLNSLNISTTVKSDEKSDENNDIANASDVTVFNQFDAITDRFAIETLEVKNTSGDIQYWSLSTTEGSFRYW